MKNKYFLTIGTLIYIFGICQIAKSEMIERPYERAIVLSGDNINTAVFVGMFDGAEASGQKPDVIIASCGGAIAAVILHAFPSRSERYAFIHSREFHELLKDIELNDISLVDFGRRLAWINFTANLNKKNQKGFITKGPRFIPDIFNFSLIKIGDEFQRIRELNQAITDSNPHVVIVAARAEFQKSEVGIGFPLDKKLFTEVYFTDPTTANYLKKLPSLVGSSVNGSLLFPNTEVLADFTLAEAARASISDPLLVNPAYLRGKYYLTGAVNIDPINVGREIAKSVIARYTGLYDPVIEQPALMATFAFDGNQVRKKVFRNGAYSKAI